MVLKSWPERSEINVYSHTMGIRVLIFWSTAGIPGIEL